MSNERKPHNGVIRLRQPHPGQAAMAAGLKRYNVARMGRRWGKTIFGFQYLLDCPAAGDKNALTGYPVAWFAPTYKYLKDPWRDAKRILKPLIVHKDEVDHRLELRTGGVIDFWTLDSDDPARGRKYARVVIDEAAMVRGLMEKWNQSIRPTLTDYRGGALFASTPRGMNDFWKLDQRSQSKPETWASFYAPSIDNPFLSREEIEEARDDMPGLDFSQEYDAQYVTAGGGVLKPEWLVTGECPAHLPTVLGVDLAISTKTSADYTAIVAMSRNPRDGAIYIRDAHRGRWQFHEIIDAIAAMSTKWRPVCVGIESNAFQISIVSELLRQSTIPARGLHRSVDKRLAFTGMAERFARNMVRMAETLPAYVSDELLGFTGGPHDAHDDVVDACSNAFSVLPSMGSSIASAGPRDGLLQLVSSYGG